MCFQEELHISQENKSVSTRPISPLDINHLFVINVHTHIHSGVNNTHLPAFGRLSKRAPCCFIDDDAISCNVSAWVDY